MSAFKRPLLLLQPLLAIKDRMFSRHKEPSRCEESFPEREKYERFQSRTTTNMSSALEGSQILLTNFTLSTWLSIGACLQCLLFIVLPRYVALLPAFVILGSRAVKGAVITKGWAKNPYLPPDQLLRKLTAPIPNEDGTQLMKAGEREVVCFLVGANHNQ